MKFNELAISKPILKAVLEQNYTTPTLVQEKTIPLILAKKDIIASAPTGTGKTAAFALPILQLFLDRQDAPKRGKKIKALVLSPTRELAIQIDANFKTYSKYTNLRSTVVYGGVPLDPQIDVLNKGVDVLVATPGRLLDLHKQDVINLDYIEILVLDEADLMLDMGFADDIQKVERLCPEEKQVLLFSATMPDKVTDLASDMLNEPEKVWVAPTSSAAKGVAQHLYYVPKRKKMELCLHLLRNTVKGQILIFRRTKFGTDKLEQTLLNNNYKAVSLHGDKSQTARQEALAQFKKGEANILIATDVASRGIDISGLDAVINFDMPNVPEIYVHRIGRTGRAGATGQAYSFCGADEKSYVVSIQKLLKKPIPTTEDNPYPLDPKEKPQVHKKSSGSKYRKGRKSVASKKKKKRWY
jgi:ATP-dependent RNA helicase RhlE